MIVVEVNVGGASFGLTLRAGGVVACSFDHLDRAAGDGGGLVDVDPEGAFPSPSVRVDACGLSFGEAGGP